MSPTNLNKDKISSLDEIKELNNYFKDLINQIPVKIFFNKNEDILQTIENSKRKKFFNNKELSNKSKNKRIKLDTMNYQRVSDVAQEYVEQKESDGKMNELRKKLSKRIRELRELRMGGKGKKINDKTNTEPTAATNNNDDDDDDEITETTNNNMPKIFNKEGNLVFSKFDLTTQVDLAAEREMEKIRKNRKNKKNKSLKGLLEKVKNDDEKLTKLEQIDSNRANEMKKKKIWETVLEKSDGNKIRDDPRLIEKSLKRQKLKKVKSAKLWNQRKEGVKRRQQINQERRQHMIDERKNKRKERRLKRHQKKLKQQNN